MTFCPIAAIIILGWRKFLSSRALERHVARLLRTLLRPRIVAGSNSRRLGPSVLALTGLATA